VKFLYFKLQLEIPTS